MGLWFGSQSGFVVVFLNEVLHCDYLVFCFRKNPNWQAAASSPIDYCYVHPRHIPTINALCRHFFWPGVDLSESLQYPDFSVVALYK